jgi:hypothetical protein
MVKIQMEILFSLAQPISQISRVGPDTRATKALGAVPAQQLAPQQNLQARVNQQAQEIRAQQPQAEPVQAAQGGLINRYDLGGIVNNMMLQASRSRDNIPSNAIS